MDDFDIPLDDIAAGAEEEPDVDEETRFINPPIDAEQAGGTSERRHCALVTTTKTPADNRR